MIVEQLYEIIDTKIQFINFQTKQIVESITGIKNPSALDINEDQPTSVGINFSHNNCDSFITLMEEYSRSKRLLLLMRSMLNDKNTTIIYNFISTNAFMNFNERELKLMINIKVYTPDSIHEKKETPNSTLLNKKSSSTNRTA